MLFVKEAKNITQNKEYCLKSEVKQMEELLKRINELAKKSREQGLSDEEKVEQAELRQKYIKKFRQDMEKTLENVYIVDENGNKKRVEKKK